MRSAEADAAFRQFLSIRGDDVDQLSADSAVEAMIDFYTAERADDVVGGDPDSDMLLFQWGTYDFGHGLSFQYDITRQFIAGDYEDDDDAIWQLALTIHFEPDRESKAIGSGERWCENPSRVDDFREFVQRSEATRYARTAVPCRVELRLEQAG